MVYTIDRPVWNHPKVEGRPVPPRPAQPGTKRHIGQAPQYMGFGRPAQSKAAQE